MNKYVTELIGTFFLVLTIGCTLLGGSTGVIPPLAISAGLMGMIYAGGHISGAHYNPAVTTAFYLRGRCRAEDVLPYWLAQIAGAALASAAAQYVVGVVGTPGTIEIGPAFVAEFLFTFALAYVVLNTATAKGTAGNPFYGVAIGLTVMAGAFSVGHISGAAFNPAVALGVALMGLASWSTLWVYLVATTAGASLAAVAFNAMHPEDR
jgi:aquaporin Z